ncbi:MAG: DUF4435 domain-containing protein [Cyclobacteriaceae bacterium]
MTEIDSIPRKGLAYRASEDLFYLQWNDISFFVEDENQQNFYHCILKTLFPEIKIEKIFPLGGKDPVLIHCKSNLGDKTKIYLVDKDFDDILNKIEEIDNLFYLERYSIENYLIDKDSLIDYIISERPLLNRNTVVQDLEIDTIISNIKLAIYDLVLLHFVVQRKCNSLKNISMGYERFVEYDGHNFNLKQDQIDWYKSEIENELQSIDRRIRLNAQIRTAANISNFSTNADVINHYPGKYILKMIKQIIENKFGLNSRVFNSFCYRLADKSNFSNLDHIKESINDYINE